MRADWISVWWQAALLPDTWDVGGIVVPSLSVWHTFALEQIGCGYLYDGRPCDRNDATSLLLFARHGYRDGRRLMLDQSFRKSEERRVFRVVAGQDWKTLDAACSEYVQTCTRHCDRFDSASGGHPPAVPYQWHILSRLTGGDVSRMERAWDTPFALARCLYDAAAEANGDTSIMSPRAQEMADNWGDYKDRQGFETVRVM